MSDKAIPIQNITEEREMIDEQKPPMEGHEEASKIEDKKDRLITHVAI